jgi:ankyrin repeat protein
MRNPGILTLALVLGATSFLNAGTSLSRAATRGDLPRVMELVKKGEKVNEVDKWGWTPLLWAVFYQSEDVTKYLLEQGADVNVTATRPYSKMMPGTTPLIIASYYGLDNMIDMLLQKGAKVDAKDLSGKTALDYATQFKFDGAIQRLTKAPAAQAPAAQAPAAQPEKK